LQKELGFQISSFHYFKSDVAETRKACGAMLCLVIALPLAAAMPAQIGTTDVQDTTPSSSPRSSPSESAAVTLNKMRCTVPGRFQEAKELAVAEQIGAPGRFEFREGRAFYDTGSGEIIQLHVSDNPLIGFDYERAQKKFLTPFGGLSERSWGVDTLAAVFVPIPRESSELAAKILVQWESGKPEAEGLVRGKRKGLVAVALVMTDKPGTIYIAKLTPDFLVEVKKKNTIMWDVEFSPSEALLGMAGVSNPGGAVERTCLAFRARTNAPVTEADLKSFSLPAQTLGKSPNFW